MATSLSEIQRAIFWAAPAADTVVWFPACVLLRAANLPKGAGPRITELRQMGYLRRQKLPSGKYGYQRAPEDEWRGGRAPMDFGGGD